MNKKLANLDRCVEVAGDDLSGRFLRKLFRWHSYTKIKRGGHKWVTLTRAKWEAELSCTQKQFRRVLEKLSRGDVPVIVKERHRYKGLVTLYLRPSDETYLAMLKGQSEVAQKGQTEVAQKGQTEVAQKGQFYIEPEYKPGEETKTATGFAVADPGKACISEETGYHHEVGTTDNVIPFPGQGGPDMKTGAEVAAGFAAAKPKPIDMLKPDKIDGLIHVWQKSGKPMPTITMKVRAQLKHLIKVRPEGKAPEILSHALANWFDVTNKAEIDAGAFKSPDQPQVGYLLKFQHIAVQVWQKAQAKSVAKPKPVSSSVQSIAQAPSMAEQHKPMTVEEMLAIDAEDDLKAAS
jgi:hypothetical protein